jgi:hypothetical protein
MPNQQLREQLAAELKRQKLPAGYVERLLAEWDDHLVDLQDERNATMNTARTPDSNANESRSAEIIDLQQRLGDPAQLAALAGQHYRKRNFLGRHPIFTFLLLPVPLIVAEIVGFFLAWMLLGGALDWLLGHVLEAWLNRINEWDHPLAGSLFFAGLSWCLIVLPPLGTAVWICRVAQRNRIDVRWPAAACCLVAIYCALFCVSWRLPTAPGNGLFMIGFTIDSSATWIAAQFIPKFALAAGIGLLLVRRAQRLQNLEECQSEAEPLRLAA